MGKVGWDGPLAVRYNYKLPELMSAVRRNAPVGRHTHDRLSDLHYTKAGFPRTGGTLQRELGKLANYRAPKGENRVEITVDLPYARIVNFGGPVTVAGKRMLFHQDGGDRLIHEVSFTVNGQNYINKGFEEWADLPVSRGIVPEWTD